MYHYAGNNPVRYTDPNGKEDVLVCIAINNKTHSGQHAMMLYRNQINPTKNLMVDANGSYGYQNGRTQASALLTYSKEVPLTLGSYISYFRGTKNQSLYVYQITGTSDNIKQLKQAMEKADFQIPIASCAASVSDVIDKSELFPDFKKTIFPKKIFEFFEKQVKNQQKLPNENNKSLEIKLYIYNLSEKNYKGENYGDY